MSTEPTQTDYLDLAKAVETAREMIGALVAGLVADGFTDREARVITAGIFSRRADETEKED